MADQGCRTKPVRVQPQERVSDEAVLYVSEGTTVVIGARAEDLAQLRSLGADRTVIVADGRAVASPEALVPAQWRAERVRAVEGWLGAFRVFWYESHAVTHADVVVDLTSHPLIQHEVPPFGYVRACSGDRAAAFAEAAAWQGCFRKPRYFTYYAEICAHESFGQTACSRCLDVCDAEAIRSNGTVIVVEPHLCQGCGSCALACPTGALSVAAPSRADLLQNIRQALAKTLGDGSVVRVIELVGLEAVQLAVTDHEVNIAVPALAAFGEELWFAALAAGAKSIVLQPSRRMPKKSLRLLRERIAIANTVMQNCGRGEFVIRLASDHEDHAVAWHRTVEQPTGTTSLPVNQAPLKRVLLNEALDALYPSSGTRAALPEGATLGSIDVERDRCVLCSSCARVCPTATIRYEEDARSARLLFLEANCIQCGACARICPTEAIRLSPRLAPSDERSVWREIQADPIALCPSCGAPVMPSRLRTWLQQRAQQLGAGPAIVANTALCRACREAAGVAHD